MVEYRRVKVGRLLDGMRVIESGLKPDDLVIVNGLQRAASGLEGAAEGGREHYRGCRSRLHATKSARNAGKAATN